MPAKNMTGVALLAISAFLTGCGDPATMNDPIFNQSGPPANIYEAAKAGDFEAAERFIIAGQWDPQYPDGGGVTPLNYAAANGNIDIIRLMVEEGADVNQVDVRGNTPLSSAKKAGKTEAVELLIELGATEEP
jgi:ankyrin repeat protein